MPDNPVRLPEITFKAVILGILLSMILAAAMTYLGLFAGMTISASIPAAVISMGVLSMFKKSNILENNIVQTAASAGESLAAGVIFTIPALILMGYWTEFDYLEIARISALGGLIGVLFTIPLRRALIVEAKLLYPEGIATAEVLRVGEKARQEKTRESRQGIKLLSLAGIAGAAMKFGYQALALWGAAVEGARSVGGAVFGMGCDLSPALISVGYIVGRNIGILVFSGGLISWVIALPIYTYLHGYEGDAIEAANHIWSTQIRYMGIGAMVVGGIWSLIKLMKPLVAGIKASLQAHSASFGDTPQSDTERDIPIKYVGLMILILLVPMFFLYYDIIPSGKIAGLLTLIMIVCGFLFSAVAAYMAGVVGSSNNPISGVTIATLLFSSLLLLALVGAGSAQGAAAAIMIAAVVCCAAAIGGDNMQDLKTGYLLGATPWKQQVMQAIGVISAALVLGLVLDILHTAYVIGSPTLSAPQATLMKSIAEGVFQGNLPWGMVKIGALIGIAIIIVDIIQEKRGSDFRVPVLAVAVGIYLPVSLSAPIFIGGMVSAFAKKMGSTEKSEKKGILFASGIITGEALMGILVAIPIFLTGNKDWWPTYSGLTWLGPVLFIAIIFWLYLLLIKRTNETD